MTPEQAHDQPSDVAAEDGKVIVDGPDGVAVTLTAEAAVETSHRLLEGGLTAQGQIVAQRNAESPDEDDGAEGEREG